MLNADDGTWVRDYMVDVAFTKPPVFYKGKLYFTERIVVSENKWDYYLSELNLETGKFRRLHDTSIFNEKNEGFFLILNDAAFFQTIKADGKAFLISIGLSDGKMI